MSDSDYKSYFKEKTWMRNIAIGSAMLLVAFAADQIPNQSGVPYIDSAAQESVEAVLNRTTEMFIIAKSINSVLSVAKSAQLNFSLGAGGSITPGAWLDPLDQLVDDFSDWLLEGAATVAIIKLSLSGIQQLGLFAFVLLTLPFLLAISHFNCKGERAEASFTRVFRPLLALLIFIRIGVPIVFIALSPVSSIFLEKPYAKASQEIKRFAFSSDEPISIEALPSAKSAAMAIASNARPFFNSLGTLVAVLFMQIIGFPLLLTWICWRFCRWLLTQF